MILVGLPEELSRGARMKNPLDSLGQTVALGVALTVVMVILIHLVAGV